MERVEALLYVALAVIGAGLFAWAIRVPDPVPACLGAAIAGLGIGLLWTPDEPGKDETA